MSLKDPETENDEQQRIEYAAKKYLARSRNCSIQRFLGQHFKGLLFPPKLKII